RGRAGQRDAYRQALASPHPVLVHDSCATLFSDAERLQAPGFRPEAPSRKPDAFGGFMKTLTSLVAVCALAFLISGCAGLLGSSHIADVRNNAGRYADRTVTIDGTVTNSWGVPLLPYKFYKVD